GVQRILAAKETTTLARRISSGRPNSATIQLVSAPDVNPVPNNREINWSAIERETTRRNSGDTAIILFTSGTEGPNKGVMLTNDNLRRHAESVGRARYYAPGDAVLCTLPKFHCYALLMCTAIPLLTGASLYIRRRFTP